MSIYRIPVHEWLKKYFAVKPNYTRSQVIKDIEAGKVPGERVGLTNQYVVFCNPDYSLTPLQPQTSAKPKPAKVDYHTPTGNKLADQALAQLSIE
jgi:hypothetical protein